MPPRFGLNFKETPQVKPLRNTQWFSKSQNVPILKYKIAILRNTLCQVTDRIMYMYII